MNLEHHNIANIFPMMQDNEYQGLLSDIRKNGLVQPIVLLEGKILDGRNRYKACLELGIDPEFEDYQGNDPAAYVVSQNLHRRHLNETQRASVAAKLADLENGEAGRNRSANLQSKTTRKEAAEKLKEITSSFRLNYCQYLAYHKFNTK